MKAAKPASGISVAKALGLAAVLGVVAGVVLANTQRPPEDLDMQAEALAKKVMPGGDPMPVPAEQPAPFVDMMAPDERSLRGIPPYPGASPRKIMGSHAASDQLMAISWFTTQDSLDDVLNFYERAFSESQIDYAVYRYPGNRRGYVSWFEHDLGEPDAPTPTLGKGVMHMVSVSVEGSNTTVLLSATEPQKILENMTPLPAGVKIPTGATPQVINMSEFGQQRATILATYDYGAGKLVDNLQTLWKETGWQVQSKTEEGTTTSMVVVLNKQQQTVVVEGRGETSQLVISVEERRQNTEGVGP